jgi:hypothetical protein
MTTIEQLGGLTAQHNEIMRRVINGSLNPISVKHALQDIIERAKKVPSVVEQVEHQLTAWKNLGVAISDEQWGQIMQQADVFEPVTYSDEPLVTGGFGYANPTAVAKKLFGTFTPPEGYTKVNYMEDTELRLAPGMKPTGELRLVHYDTNAYVGLSPEAALKMAEQDKLRLAGIEVLEYLVLWPQSGLAWDGKVYNYPNLSGLQCKYDDGGASSFVPSLARWDDDEGRQISLTVRWAGEMSIHSSSPVVREC